MFEKLNGSSVPYESLDLRVQDEAFVWKSDYFARILVDLSGMDERFKIRIANNISQGLIGRGMAGIDEDNLLRIVFGVTDTEREQGTLLSQYTGELLTRLNLPSSAITYASIDQVHLSPEIEIRIDTSLRALGLRALNMDD